MTAGMMMRGAFNTGVTNDGNDFDGGGLMRMQTGKSDNMMDKAFEDMLAGDQPHDKAGNQGNSNVLPSNDLHELKHQDSIGMQSLFNMMEPKGGDTGTTPRNDFGPLFMGRNLNPSFDLRPQVISPYLQGSAMKRSILNPTPLRHNTSLMSNTNSILPSFGGPKAPNNDLGR